MLWMRTGEVGEESLVKRVGVFGFVFGFVLGIELSFQARGYVRPVTVPCMPYLPQNPHKLPVLATLPRWWTCSLPPNQQLSYVHHLLQTHQSLSNATRSKFLRQPPESPPPLEGFQDVLGHSPALVSLVDLNQIALPSIVYTVDTSPAAPLPAKRNTQGKTSHLFGALAGGGRGVEGGGGVG